MDTVPEGDGTMLDNTVIVYLSDHGDRHHSKFYEWPMIPVGSRGGQLRTGRYLQVPGWGNTGNHTIANLYLSLLHAAGQPRKTFGDKGLQSPDHIDQTGPLGGMDDLKRDWLLKATVAPKRSARKETAVARRLL